MFLALRELSFARVRFGLMGAVVGLITVLMVLLSGLSSGLVIDGVSGLKASPASAFAFAEGTKTDSAFTRSVVGQDELDAWRARSDVADADLLGLTLVNAKNGTTPIDLALLGIEPTSFLAPTIDEGAGVRADGEVVLSDSARAEGVRLGDVITLEQIGTRLTVVGFTSGQQTFGHVDIGYLTLSAWRRVHAGVGAGEELPTPAVGRASVVALRGEAGVVPDLTAGDAAAGTRALTREESFGASPGYTAESMTMELIKAFLYAISALVVGAFFTLWTVQRTRELAVMRAMGASTRFLLADGLAQAALLLVGAVGGGLLVGVGLGALLSRTPMPFALEVGPLASGAGLIVGLGLVGALVATSRIARVDPLTALGENR